MYTSKYICVLSVFLPFCNESAYVQRDFHIPGKTVGAGCFFIYLLSF